MPKPRARSWSPGAPDPAPSVSSTAGAQTATPRSLGQRLAQGHPAAVQLGRPLSLKIPAPARPLAFRGARGSLLGGLGFEAPVREAQPGPVEGLRLD